MSDRSKTAAVLNHLPTQSSLFAKLTPDLRRQIDKAIADHTPPTYRAIFDHFKLADRGVSFTAFYYYARRIRASASLLQMADLAGPDDATLGNVLPQLIGSRLLDACIDEDIPTGTLCRLVDAYRMVQQTRPTRLRSVGLHD
jgi:hypothetical protein